MGAKSKLAADTTDPGNIMYLAGVLETYMKDNNNNIKELVDSNKMIAKNLVEITAFTKEQAITNKTIFKKFEEIQKGEDDCRSDLRPRIEQVEAAEKGRQAVLAWWKQAVLTGASMATVFMALALALRGLGYAGL